MRDPLILYVCKGQLFLKLCILSIRSLERFNYKNIIVIVSSESEKKYLKSFYRDLHIDVRQIDLLGYNAWCWRPFILENYDFPDNSNEIVICDVDILWKIDPRELFNRFEGKNWFHKITFINPNLIDSYKDYKQVPSRLIGMKNMVMYRDNIGIKAYPNFIINGGLYMMKKENISRIYKKLCEAIKKMPSKFIMTEALLSIIMAEYKIIPICDEEDIKHNSKLIFNKKLIRFNVFNKDTNKINGYKYATHYHGDQRIFMCIEALKLKIDNNLFFISLIPIFFIKNLNIRNRIKKIYNIVFKN